MQRTRRGVLGAGLVAGLAGCLAVDGVEYPSDGDGTGSVEDVSTAEESPEPDAARPSDGDENERLADATRGIVDDALWFATEYVEAVEIYRSAIRSVVSEADDVREEIDETGTVEVDLAERLEEAGRSAAETAGDVFEPHFTPREGIERRTERHAEVLHNFARRDDVDRFLEEVDRMRRGFAGIGTMPYVRTRFSRNPIHNRLLRRVLGPLPEDEDDREEVLEGTLVELAVASEGFTTYVKRPYDDEAYSREQRPRLYGDPLDGDRREEIRARFGPVVRPDDRTAELLFAFADRPLPDEDPEEVFRGWPADLDGTVLYVQRYSDPDTAADRFAAVTADGRVEDDEPINPAVDRTDGREEATHWHRIHHDEARGERYRFDEHAGVQYGYVVRAGEFLLATGFSGDAWEERAGWQGRLGDGWAIR